LTYIDKYDSLSNADGLLRSC